MLGKYLLFRTPARPLLNTIQRHTLRQLSFFPRFISDLSPKPFISLHDSAENLLRLCRDKGLLQGEFAKRNQERLRGYTDPLLLLMVLQKIQKLTLIDKDQQISQATFDKLLSHPDLKNLLNIFELHLKLRSMDPSISDFEFIEIDLEAILSFPSTHKLYLGINEAIHFNSSDKPLCVFARFVEDMRRITPLLKVLKQEFFQQLSANDFKKIAELSRVHQFEDINASCIQRQVENFLRRKFGKLTSYFTNETSTIFIQAAKIDETYRACRLSAP